MGFPTREEIRDFENCKEVINKRDAEIADLKCEIEKYRAEASEYKKKCEDAEENLKNCKTALKYAEDQLEQWRKSYRDLTDNYNQQIYETARCRDALVVILSILKSGKV